MPVMNFINNVGYVLICVVGGFMASRNMIDLGDVQAFIQYSRRFTMPIAQLSKIANVLQSTLASAERVFEVLEEEELIEDRPDALNEFVPRGDVAFSGLHFGYNENQMLMNGVDLDVKSGQTAAIVGPTGAGKTTLVNLLMRFYEIQGGKISIDGVDLRDIRRGSLRNIFGMVLQDTWLFKGSIRDNIAYGRQGASDEEIHQSAVAAHADHFIRALPEGDDTVINEEAFQAQAATSEAQIGVIHAHLKDNSIPTGIRGTVDTIAQEEGDVTQPGQTILTVNDLDNLWITANIKETEIARVRPGAKVKITVDAFRKIPLEGAVEKIYAGIVPPAFQIGEFTKTTQRIPVRIHLINLPDMEALTGLRLLPGMSVEVKISTGKSAES